jgi:hypothetical protein
MGSNHQGRHATAVAGINISATSQQILKLSHLTGFCDSP